jgi:hypothetical protein
MSLLFSGKWRIRLLQNAFTRLKGFTSQKNAQHELIARRISLLDMQRGFKFTHCMAC